MQIVKANDIPLHARVHVAARAIVQAKRSELSMLQNTGLPCRLGGSPEPRDRKVRTTANPVADEGRRYRECKLTEWYASHIREARSLSTGTLIVKTFRSWREEATLRISHTVGCQNELERGLGCSRGHRREALIAYALPHRRPG